MRPRPVAPDRGALSGVLVGPSFLGGIAAAMALSDHPYPRPGSDAATIRRYFRADPRPGRVSAAGQLLSTAALARFTTSVAALAGRSGPGSPALRAAALAGGTTAVASLATSATLAGTLTTSRADSDDAVLTLHRWAFLAGGVAHGAGFGMLVGVLGLAGLRTGELPRPLALTALASAGAGLLSPLYLVAEPAAWFIPAGRFSGLVVSAVAGLRLARGSR